MKPLLGSVCTQEVVCCRVGALGAVQAGAAILSSWRRQPPVPAGHTLPANFLRNADVQTIAGLAALYQAMHQHQLHSSTVTDVHFSGRAGGVSPLILVENQGAYAPRSPKGNSRNSSDQFDWGVIAASTFLGRSALAVACQRYSEEGAWAISPNLIPHHSLHAVSGTLSQALNLHGPNFGIGGGPTAPAEGFVMAATLMAEGDLPGLWLVITGFEPELVPQDPTEESPTGQTLVEPLCQAVALALQPLSGMYDGPRLLIGIKGTKEATAHLPQLSLHGLVTALVANPLAPSGRWRWQTGGWIELLV